jgi:hypothetical protein
MYIVNRLWLPSHRGLIFRRLSPSRASLSRDWSLRENPHRPLSLGPFKVLLPFHGETKVRVHREL